MAEEEMVPGAGWVSDDSSFYGDEEEQQRQQDLCENFNPKPFWRTHHKNLNTIAFIARAPELAGIATTDALEVKKASPSKASSATASKTSKFSSIDRKAMEQERLARLGKRKRDASPSPQQAKAQKPCPPTLELFNFREGQSDAWQLGESVEDFIKRLPPYTTSMSTYPWIWAENPYRNPRDKSASPQIDYFTSRGMELLEESLQKRHDIQAEGAHGPRGMVTRLLNQESKALQQRIASLASETHVLSGKWMLFPNSVEVTRIWKQVVASVIDNRLGPTCKVATDDGSDARLICVYTKDFQDANDVRRVLDELETMGLVNAGKVIYYKPDAYTYLDLKRDTAAQYGLQASLYNSRSMMAAGTVSKSTSSPQKKQTTLKKFF